VSTGRTSWFPQKPRCGLGGDGSHIDHRDRSTRRSSVARWDRPHKAIGRARQRDRAPPDPWLLLPFRLSRLEKRAPRIRLCSTVRAGGVRLGGSWALSGADGEATRAATPVTATAVATTADGADSVRALRLAEQNVRWGEHWLGHRATAQVEPVLRKPFVRCARPGQGDRQTNS
jgi:hypothetical protein